MTETPDAALARAMGQLSAASDAYCTCHDTPLDNCLDVEQAIKDYGDARAKQGRREALTCVCGHLWQLHDGHTYSPPRLPPSHCSQADGCMVFTPPAAALLLAEIQEGGEA